MNLREQRLAPATLTRYSTWLTSARCRAWLVLLWSVAIGGGLFALFHTRSFDDPYITYRYAENVARGNGFVYNLGEYVQSTTTPMYTVLLALAAWIGFDLPVVSAAIGCASIACGGYALWQLGQTWNTPVAGAVGLVLYPLFPLMIPTLGAETAWYTALVLLGLVAYARERYVAVAVLLGFATLTRADGVVAAILVAAHFVVFRRQRPPWIAILLFCTLLVLWFGWAWWYFGSPLPVTLSAKQQQGQMQISRSFWGGLQQQAGFLWNRPLYRLHFVFAGVGFVYALVRARSWLLLAAWTTTYTLAYTLLGVSSYFWYYAPITAGFVGLAALGIEGCASLLKHGLPSSLTVGLAAAATVVLSVPQMQSLAGLRATNDQRLPIYIEVGQWLRANTPATASVGTLEVGIIGYHSQRRMIDFAGLIQPSTALRMEPTSTYEDTALWATQAFRPEYLVLHRGLFSRLESDAAVQHDCTLVKSFEHAAYPHSLDVYRCSWTTTSAETFRDGDQDQGSREQQRLDSRSARLYTPHASEAVDNATESGTSRSTAA